MPDIFKKRVNIKPHEYPELIEFIDAIRHSYWIHEEFNFSGDVQDFKVNCSNVEKTVIQRTMLAIAQIEVAVKSFWGDVGKRLPKPEISSVGATFSECHVEGTEILTTKGWKDFRDITKDTLVAQVDVSDSTITFTTPTHITNKKYVGDVHYMENQRYSFAVTPRHRMIYKTRSGNILEKEIKDIGSFHSDLNLPFTAELLSNGGELSLKDKLRIALQADGSPRYYRNNDGDRVRRGLSNDCHTYEITLKKERKKTRILGLLDELDIDYREFDDKRKKYVKYEIDVPTSWGDLKTFDWVDLSEATSDWCRSFIDEIGQWDGCIVEGTHNYKDTFMVYSSTEKTCADKVQAIGTLAGYRATFGTHKDDRKQSYKDVYSVSFANRKKFSSITTENKTKPYSGRVYCVSVPTGCIITRHNDKVLISGNSEVRHMDAYSHLLEILGLNDEFENIENIPAIQDRMDYLEKYQVGRFSDENEDFALSLLLFSIFIEHVSLFSQFLIMTSFDKYEKKFKGIANAVEATSKEEQIHGLFGVKIIEIIQEENPEWFGRNFEVAVQKACAKAFKAENKILDWIFEDGELDFMSREDVEVFLKDKFNQSLESVDVEPIFEVDEDVLENTYWFYEDILMTKDNDFFSKRGTTYNKNTQSVTSDDLF